jgi:hypothetical protein
VSTARHRGVTERAIDWRAYRIVSSRYPPVGLWDRIADPADFEHLAEIEGLTNPRIREEQGILAAIPRERWVSGPGTSPVMAAFTHVDPEGSRFSDGSFGVFYAAHEIETAIRETVYHRERFLARTAEPAQQLQMRCYTLRVKNKFHDIRGGHPRLHDAEDYAASQAFGRRLRDRGSNGVVFDSVRRQGGECVAAFWPDCVGRCSQGKHFVYHWNGASITQVSELRAVEI